ncbi:MAG TPA: alpha/beta hydrolase-fold protein [Acidimicrobiales bacterium]
MTTTPPSAISWSLPTTMDSPADLPGYHVYRPADLDATGRPLPVVVWANGGCFRWDRTWQPLLERWAEAGFFVVAIAEPPEGDPVESGVTTAADQGRAIDWASAQQDEASSPYAGHLDLGRVVAAGNSCGGITSLTLAGQDDRVRSVFVLSGSSVGPGATREQASAVMTRVSVPVGFAVGAAEDIASSQAAQDYDVLPDGVPGFVASRASGDHVTVSTDTGILVEVAEIGVNWIDLSLYGTETARRAVAEHPCGSCAPDLWTVTAKHLDSLSLR